MDKWVPIVIQILIVVLSGSGGWFLLKSQRGKINAEARDTTVATMAKLSSELRLDLDRANDQIDRLMAQVEVLKEQAAAIRVLTIEQIKGLDDQIAVLREHAEVLMAEAKALRSDNALLTAETGKLQAEVASFQQLRIAGREELTTLALDLTSTQRRLLALTKGTSLLISQIRKLDLEPAWVDSDAP